MSRQTGSFIGWVLLFPICVAAGSVAGALLLKIVVELATWISRFL